MIQVIQRFILFFCNFSFIYCTEKEKQSYLLIEDSYQQSYEQNLGYRILKAISEDKLLIHKSISMIMNNNISTFLNGNDIDDIIEDDKLLKYQDIFDSSFNMRTQHGLPCNEEKLADVIKIDEHNNKAILSLSELIVYSKNKTEGNKRLLIIAVLKQMLISDTKLVEYLQKENYFPKSEELNWGNLIEEAKAQQYKEDLGYLMLKALPLNELYINKIQHISDYCYNDQDSLNYIALFTSRFLDKHKYINKFGEITKSLYHKDLFLNKESGDIFEELKNYFVLKSWLKQYKDQHFDWLDLANTSNEDKEVLKNAKEQALNQSKTDFIKIILKEMLYYQPQFKDFLLQDKELSESLNFLNKEDWSWPDLIEEAENDVNLEKIMRKEYVKKWNQQHTKYTGDPKKQAQIMEKIKQKQILNRIKYEYKRDIEISHNNSKRNKLIGVLLVVVILIFITMIMIIISRKKKSDKLKNSKIKNHPYNIR